MDLPLPMKDYVPNLNRTGRKKVKVSEFLRAVEQVARTTR
jgi:hypothetical protein